MAIHKIMVALLFVFTLANVGDSTGQVLKGSVSCLDCHKDYDFSGIKVALKCKEAKKLTVTITNKDGSFKTGALPTDISASTASNCVASVLGGPEQLYTKTKNMITNIIKVHEYSYTISNPLSFYKSCPLSHGKCGATGGIEASKTFDLPPLGEWGFPPSSPYIPFFPIIGIP
ncbi:uncharacterized protein LOC141688936 [Apium graveolens]|uniref:uncharacterized protein LOC141688936 n=1 Tax=Apium graveolens TaxID=4045 RepID=UPI003D7954DF